MRIGIDIRALGRGTHSGVEEYVVQITRALLRAYPAPEWRLFTSGWRRRDLPDDILEHPNARLVILGMPNRLLDVAGILLGVPKIDRIVGGVDLFFSPHFFWASMASAPRVVTVHDLSFLRYPEFFPLQKRLWHASMSVGRQLRDASHVIAVSESTKEDLMAFYGLPEQRITVIAEGVSRDDFSPIAEGDPGLARFKRLHRLPDQFILFLGTREPRKNVLGTLRAFDWLRTEGKISRDVAFVIAGNAGWLGGELMRFIRDRRLGEAVRFSTVSASERRYWYHAASAVVFPSFFEGFGLPPLEAMACGTPVIVSNRSSLPEVVHDAAIAVDPYRPEEIAEAVLSVLTDRALREHLRERGMLRAEEFSWERAARRTFDVFQKVLHG